MAAFLGAFLLWLFATGKYADWVALVSAPAKPVATSASKTPTAAPATQAPAMVPTDLIKTGGAALNAWTSAASFGDNVEPEADLYANDYWTGSA